jgi:hypothetical protein
VVFTIPGNCTERRPQGDEENGKFLLKDLKKTHLDLKKIKILYDSNWPMTDPKNIVTQGIRPRISNPFLYQTENLDRPLTYQ